ncbi:MAG TPA: plastocyanin/azurin family copper-binding protein [Solirubrobacterales bacterium]|nr:plastocyanin/azurin family copper-binding protein [Solirubrobacterales bacterium]
MRRAPKFVLLPVLAALAAAGAGCGDDDDAAGEATGAQPAGTQATINTFMYEPDPVEVVAGDTVTWTNEDDILHTVTATKTAESRFDERLDGAGTTAEVTFDEPGTYEYICSVHDGMKGSVVVR